MAEWTTLSVKKTTHDRFNDAKQEMDDAQPQVPPLSADQFLQALLDTLEHAQDGEYDSEPYASVTLDGDDLMDNIRDELDDLLTVNVSVDLSDESDLSEDDVQRIVTDKIERSVHERARQL